jgi:hypothetical protein
VDVQRALKDLLAGGIFIGFGLAFAIGAATSYEIGTTLRMGPGYFPLLVGGLLTVLGGLIVAKGFIAGEGAELGSIPWKAAVLILGAFVVFGATVRGLGLIPSLFITVLMAAFAGQRTSIVAPVAIAVGLTILSILIFIVALQLRLPLIGPWIGG